MGRGREKNWLNERGTGLTNIYPLSSLSLSFSPSVSEVCSCINLKHKLGSLIHYSLGDFLISRYKLRLATNLTCHFSSHIIH